MSLDDMQPCHVTGLSKKINCSVYIKLNNIPWTILFTFSVFFEVYNLQEPFTHFNAIYVWNVNVISWQCIL